ncbi:alpha/beta hydrolase [Palleronia caenipelagi]|uniref:Alpha/beta fold hydrolase n=1 Tax=Palleronia caenipelagi TaxID=2489174 RepID=A0A547Q594_9RHOB|nr:alpha/beta fold hydrolase [Palleronia caenipelagi]TRD21554.1 alpha/beta fold hydrolase [Palleronia caenipelagi]
MVRVLDSKRRPSQSGKTGSVVVFLHGYGADGADLLGLADPLAPHLPDTVFLAPDAPERSVVNPMGYQWFPIPWIDGSDPAEAEAGMDRATEDLRAYLASVLEQEGITEKQLVLVGFSQGTMMMLHVALRAEKPCAALVGFSGRLLRPESLEDEITARPPVLLIHGDQDDVVPPQSLPAAAEALQAAGLDVYAHISKGTGHGIAPDGLSIALAFIRDRLGLDHAE